MHPLFFAIFAACKAVDSKAKTNKKGNLENSPAIAARITALQLPQKICARASTATGQISLTESAQKKRGREAPFACG
ncbi:MAG: hypothetical protein HY255_05180 [Betaproteobacteria bacterium]|nr:hypothetical protein [Betaproteobacteria bacterium]